MSEYETYFFPLYPFCLQHMPLHVLHCLICVQLQWLNEGSALVFCPQAFDADLREYLKQVTSKEVIASQVHEVGGYIRVKGLVADHVSQFLLDKGFWFVSWCSEQSVMLFQTKQWEPGNSFDIWAFAFVQKVETENSQHMMLLQRYSFCTSNPLAAKFLCEMIPHTKIDEWDGKFWMHTQCRVATLRDKWFDNVKNLRVTNCDILTMDHEGYLSNQKTLNTGTEAQDQSSLSLLPFQKA